MVTKNIQDENYNYILYFTDSKLLPVSNKNIMTKNYTWLLNMTATVTSITYIDTNFTLKTKNNSKTYNYYSHWPKPIGNNIDTSKQ